MSRLRDQLLSEVSEDAREYYEERAAVLEYDAGMPRERAERVAFALLVAYIDREKRNE